MGQSTWGLLVSQSFSAFYLQFSSNFKMSCPVNTFNKSKEDFIWFVKRAVSDKKSHSHSEMYHSLLKLFVDADTNKDGLVSRASFSKLIDAAAEMPRAYGYAPEDSALYKTEAEKDAARQKMFDSMDLKSTGVITFDEWLKFCQEHIAAKTATMPWIHIPSLTMGVWRSTRSSSRSPSVPLPALNRWNCTGTCSRSSLTTTLTWMVSSRWRSSQP